MSIALCMAKTPTANAKVGQIGETMKPYNKMRWQKANAKRARKPLDEFETWMNGLCENCGVRRWNCHCPTKRAVELGDSAASQTLSTPEVNPVVETDSTPAPTH